MGRGRAKAKQQKVARELKYNSRSTDLDALQRELGGSAHSYTDTVASNGFADDDDDEDEHPEDDWAAPGR